MHCARTQLLWSSLLPLVFVTRQALSQQCATQGPQNLFRADFEGATVGSPPPAISTGYGPGGAAIQITNAANNAVIVNSTALGSRALQLTRANPATTVEFLWGDAGDTPCTGRYIISFRAVGDPVPQYFISGTGIEVKSMEGRTALALRLFGGVYHHRQGDAYLPLSGSYDPTQPHTVTLSVYLDAHAYTVCVNGVVLAAGQPILDPDFRVRRGLAIQLSPMITEGFPAGFILDDVRVTK